MWLESFTSALLEKPYFPPQLCCTRLLHYAREDLGVTSGSLAACGQRIGSEFLSLLEGDAVNPGMKWHYHLLGFQLLFQFYDSVCHTKDWNCRGGKKSSKCLLLFSSVSVMLLIFSFL